MATGSGIINYETPKAVEPAAIASPPPVGSTTGTAIPAGQATAHSATATTYTPNAFRVTSDQLVRDQLKGVINSGSPLIELARTNAAQRMTDYGLQNSSLAVGAGEKAVIETALPIAQADAATQERAATNTVNAKNAAAQFGAQATNDASKFNAQQGTQVSMANADAFNKLQLANVDNATRLQLSQLDGRYRSVLQANQNAQGAFNQVATAIANISQNPNMTPDAKAAAVASQVTMLNEFLRTTQAIAAALPEHVAGLNLGQYFANAGGLGLQASNLPPDAAAPAAQRYEPDGTYYPLG